MSGSKKEKAVDGRRLRSERSRQAIIDATEDLMNDGNLIPTAQAIAERAGVGIRSFFRHFADMDSLFTAVDEQGRDRYESRFLGGDREGELDERILHAVERHAEDNPVVLGRMAARVLQPVTAGNRYVTTAWPIGREGRKLFSGTALFAADGTLHGYARQTWIVLG